MALVALCPFAPARAGLTDWQVCAAAAAAAEQRFGIPNGLLLAIGHVETGRSGPGGAAPWPWSINAAGQDQILASLPEAVAAVRARQAGGVASIDVGCFQVNLMYHPAAFASMEEAFDPVANATYAAAFLASLHTRTGGWQAAVAAYHSATPARGLPYRDRVLADWGGAAPERAPVVAFGVRVITPSRLGTAPGVIVLRRVGALLPMLVHGRG